MPSNICKGYIDDRILKPLIDSGNGKVLERPTINVTKRMGATLNELSLINHNQRCSFLPLRLSNTIHRWNGQAKCLWTNVGN